MSGTRLMRSEDGSVNRGFPQRNHGLPEQQVPVLMRCQQEQRAKNNRNPEALQLPRLGTADRDLVEGCSYDGHPEQVLVPVSVGLDETRS